MKRKNFLVLSEFPNRSRSAPSPRTKLKWNLPGLILAILFSGIAHADNIYKWTDAEGRTYYSTSPKGKDDVPANLPELGRENINGSIDKIRSTIPPNCGSHGGIDCTSGADVDGSVICVDGFRDAQVPFRFHCLESVLEAELSSTLHPKDSSAPLASRKDLTRLGPRAKSFEISVRNNSGVKAIGVSVELTKDDTAVTFEGPKSIKPYGIGDYVLVRSNIPFRLNSKTLEEIRFQISCSNCRGRRTLPK